MTQAHYYGDTVRSLLISIAVIMVVTMPFFTDLIPKPSFFSILAVLVIVLLSGWVSPKHKVIVGMTTLVSAGAFIAFQYYALNTFQAQGFKSAFFLVNELLAILSIIATYYGSKSIRGIILAEGL
jgi:hypothetical protein